MHLEQPDGIFISVGTADSIEAADDAAARDAESKLATYKRQTGGEQVPELGDGAVRSASGIAFIEGDAYFEITTLRVTDDQLFAIAELAAERSR